MPTSLARRACFPPFATPCTLHCGLFAVLIRLHRARTDARFGPDGDLVLLQHQDRSRWDHDAITDATQLVEQAAGSFSNPDQALEGARLQTWVRPGSDADGRVVAAVRERLVEREGRFALDWAPLTLGFVTWIPGATPVSDA